MQDIDLAHLSDAELCDVMLQAQAGEAAFKSLRLKGAAEYDRREAWQRDGATSMPAWMVGMLGAGRDTANEEVRVALRFDELPAISAAFRNGELSWDQARAVSEFATPETDAHLAEEARKFSAPHLRRMAKRFKPIANDVARDAMSERSLRMWWDVERNMLKLSGQLAAAEGAAVEKTLDRILRQIVDEGPNAEGPYDHNRLRADALVELATTRMSQDADRERATVGVHIDAAVLDGVTGMAELDTAQPIAIDTAKRLLCDARWYIVLDGADGEAVGVGRTTRQVPAWLRREIKHRDAGCRFPGCCRQGWTDVHHMKPWAEGGDTNMDNLVTLCGLHHSLVHEGGWTIVGDPNCELAFVDPTGRAFAQGPAPLRKELRDRIERLVCAAADRPPGMCRMRERVGPAP